MYFCIKSIWICRFPLPLGVWEGLRFVIVAVPGHFSYPFFGTSKIEVTPDTLPHLVAFTTDIYVAVILMLFVLSVALWMLAAVFFFRILVSFVVFFLFFFFFVKWLISNILVTITKTRLFKYSRLSLSRTPRESMKQFEISVLRHIRFADSGKQLIEQLPLTE